MVYWAPEKSEMVVNAVSDSGRRYCVNGRSRCPPHADPTLAHYPVDEVSGCSTNRGTCWKIYPAASMPTIAAPIRSVARRFLASLSRGKHGEYQLQQQRTSGDALGAADCRKRARKPACSGGMRGCTVVPSPRSRCNRSWTAEDAVVVSEKSAAEPVSSSSCSPHRERLWRNNASFLFSISFLGIVYGRPIYCRLKYCM
jgi:hypothetical protein